ncbi:LAETG motif-containing sortase-dependent surface protein [Embleya sp. MST-111070]|uniref:LAETG motif-containing sortase-dependent surface protein n=1 Tax=Embleya sp. MST-111070 TaxID=3398231 RepID=UPI003F733657
MPFIRLTPVRASALAAGTAAALLIGPAATSAVADTPAETYLWLDSRDTYTAVPGKDRTYSIDIENYGPATVKDLVVTVDTADLKGVTSVVFPSQCTVKSTVATCRVGEVKPHNPESNAVKPTLDLKLRTDAATKPGTKGKLKYSGTASNATVRVDLPSYGAEIVVNSGYDLVAKPLADSRREVAPGAALDMPGSFSNVGDRPAKGVLVALDARPGIGFAQRYQNCRYFRALAAFGEEALCRFDDVEVKPGDAYALDKSVPLRASSDMMWGGAGIAFYAADDVAADMLVRAAAKGAPGTEGTLKLVKQQPNSALRSTADLDDWNNSTSLSAHTTLKADFAAIGATARGTQGQTVKIRPGIENRGPGRVDDYALADLLWSVKMAVPEGATVTKVPEFCRLSTEEEQDFGGPLYPGFDAKGRPAYVCAWHGDGGTYKPGSKGFFEFEMRIDKVVPDAAGMLQSSSVDDNRADDVAQVVLNSTKPAPGAASGGSGSAGGGTTTGGAGASGGGNGTELANTGDSSSTMVIAGAAVALFAVGGGAFFVVRRRKAAGLAV